MDRRVEPLRSQKLARTKAGIAERISRVCSHLPEDEFAALVERMAILEIKYETRGHLSLSPPVEPR